MKQPTIKIAERRGFHPESVEVHLNKSAIELIKSDFIAFFMGENGLVMRIPSVKDKAYKISKHTQIYKKKEYNSSAKFTPLVKKSKKIMGKYAIERRGNNFKLAKQ